MTFAMLAEDDTGNRRYLGTIEKCLGGFAAVMADARNIRKGVKGAGGFFASKTQLIQTRE